MAAGVVYGRQWQSRVNTGEIVGKFLGKTRVVMGVLHHSVRDLRSVEGLTRGNGPTA